MHIAIEGMDGVGKTTICNLLKDILNYKLVEKPLQYILNKDEDFIDIYKRTRDIINHGENKLLSTMFYLLGTVVAYDYFKNINIITDRFYLSNFAWSLTDEYKDLYKYIIRKIGKPNLTVILYANKNVIRERMAKRKENDSNINKIPYTEIIYKRMISFSNELNLNYVVINTEEKTPQEIVNLILEKWNESK